MFTEIKVVFVVVCIALVMGGVAFVAHLWTENKHLRGNITTQKDYQEHGVAVTSDEKFFQSMIDSSLLVKAKQDGIASSSIREINTINTITHTILKTSLRDSILYDSVHVECVNFNDSYTSVRGCFGNNAYPVMDHRDTLSIVLYVVKESRKGIQKALLWPLKRKSHLESKIFNADSNSTYSVKSIRLDK